MICQHYLVQAVAIKCYYIQSMCKTLYVSFIKRQTLICGCNSQINGQSMVNKSQDDALVLLRNTPPGGTVQLVVNRQALKQSAPDNVVMV